MDFVPPDLEFVPSGLDFLPRNLDFLHRPGAPAFHTVLAHDGLPKRLRYRDASNKLSDQRSRILSEIRQWASGSDQEVEGIRYQVVTKPMRFTGA